MSGGPTRRAPGAAFDYDAGEIHRTYASGRRLAPEQVALWRGLLRDVVGAGGVQRALDLGCGVGRFAALLGDAFGASVYGIDRSERMLAAAAADDRHRARWIRGSAEAVPLRGGSVDLVFLFLVLHHIVDRRAVLAECARVLVPPGWVVIVNSTAETLDGYEWLPFFPSARAIDLGRLPTRHEVTRAATEAGLVLHEHRTVMNPVAPNRRVYADRIATRTISTLQLVPDDEFSRGVVAFRRHCDASDDGRPVIEPIDCFVFRRAE